LSRHRAETKLFPFHEHALCHKRRFRQFTSTCQNNKIGASLNTPTEIFTLNRPRPLCYSCHKIQNHHCSKKQDVPYLVTRGFGRYGLVQAMSVRFSMKTGVATDSMTSRSRGIPLYGVGRCTMEAVLIPNIGTYIHSLPKVCL
jgi:hypothetical protein